VTVFGPLTGDEPLRQFVRVVPVLVIVKLATFLILGVYRGLWRYVGVDSLVIYVKAVSAGSALSVLALVFAFRFEGLSRAVFVLDGLLLLMLLVASRLAFRLFRKLIPQPAAEGGRRVLIYGAGDAGALLAGELLCNPSHRRVPVGFADDDPRKKGKTIHGLRVLGGNGAFLSICSQQLVEEVVISSQKIPPERVDEIARVCTSLSVPVRRLRFEIEPLDELTAPEVAPDASRPAQTGPCLA
jgi:UDP-GlcNAc:undecaprenyl-phosphate GlcNAc-1-phosphate transferase